jgi:hypothetical protein
LAEGNLKRYMVEYGAEDGWSAGARSMLGRIAER